MLLYHSLVSAPDVTAALSLREDTEKRAEGEVIPALDSQTWEGWGGEGAGSGRSRQSAGQAVSITDLQRAKGCASPHKLSSQLLCRFATFRMKDGEELKSCREVTLCLCAGGDEAESHAVPSLHACKGLLQGLRVCSQPKGRGKPECPRRSWVKFPPLGCQGTSVILIKEINTLTRA